MKSLSILYHDQHLVAVNKPSGLLVHRSAIDRHETENAMRTVRNQLRQWVYPFHRLDKATSGVLLFALDTETARRMTASFTGGEVEKSYLAIVRGYVDEAGRIDHSLKEQVNALSDQRIDKDKPPQQAVTEYRRLATVEVPEPVGRYATGRFSLVQVTPLTGRNHQIRRHMKHVFHPVVGDTTYGDGKQNDFFRSRFNCHRLLLHAGSLGFEHPYTGERIGIEAPLDRTFLSVLEELHWDQVPALFSPGTGEGDAEKENSC